MVALSWMQMGKFLPAQRISVMEAVFYTERKQGSLEEHLKETAGKRTALSPAVPVFPYNGGGSSLMFLRVC